MNDLIASFVKSMMQKKAGDVSESVMGGGAAPTPMVNMTPKSFDQTSAGKAIEAFNLPDASISSVYQAAQNPQMSASLDGFTQAPELRQGVLGSQQFSSGGNQNIGGIQDLLKQYGQGSQGLLPYFGNQ